MGSTRTVTAENTSFINAGTRASRPQIDGLDSSSLSLDNISIMELDKVPEHLLVLGGGYIGLEFGQLFRALEAVSRSCSRGRITEHEKIRIRCGRDDKIFARGWNYEFLLNTQAT